MCGSRSKDRRGAGAGILSTCLEANNIPSIGLTEATTTNNGAIGIIFERDSMIGLLFRPAPSSCDYIVRYVDSSDTRSCGIAITRIAVLEFNEMDIFINMAITLMILLVIVNMVGQWL
mgnify:FL=1